MPFQLNLAEKTYLNRRSVRLWLTLIGGALCFLIGLNLLFAYQNYRHYQRMGVHLAELDVRLDAHRNGMGVLSPEQVDILARQMQAANQLVAADRFQWTQLLGRFEDLMPPHVALRSIRPDFERHSLQITAVARDLRDMTAFLDALLDSPDLSHVSLQRHADQEERSADGRSRLVTHFSLKIEEAF